MKASKALHAETTSRKPEVVCPVCGGRTVLNVSSDGKKKLVASHYKNLDLDLCEASGGDWKNGKVENAPLM
jgi:hypothetical protein